MSATVTDVRSVKEIVNDLMEKSKGYLCWRVRDKDTKAYCIEFPWYEANQAKTWWEEQRVRFPEMYSNSELAEVRVVTGMDELMQEAAIKLSVLHILSGAIANSEVVSETDDHCVVRLEKETVLALAKEQISAA